jgi:hypothetical protein
MSIKNSCLWLSGALALSLAACGGGSGSVATNPPSAGTQSAAVPLILSDASSEDWALIGVKVLKVTLTPQGGGTTVTIFTAQSPAPLVNLAQLDQVGDILANASVPQGTYTQATLTVGANAGDVLLTVAADPQPGFDGVPGSSIPADQIQIQGKQGSAPNLTAAVKVAFATPWVVGASQNGALDLEVDLSHPAFIVAHRRPGAAATTWAVNFDGPVRHHAVKDLRRLVLRHTYGHVTAVAADNASISIVKDLPVLPVQSPEVPVSTATTLQIQADAVNGTLYHDVDAGTGTLIKDFAAQSANLVGRYVRVAARYQQDGTLVATRIWSASEFNKVWFSPEGHVLHVDTLNAIVEVAGDSGAPVSLHVDANTQFFFRTPQDAQADATPIGTGPAFLAAHHLVRGFKIHATVVDPLAATLVAQSVDIETAVYDGRITGTDTSGFIQSRAFNRASDDYSYPLNYIPADDPNGSDAQGNAVLGFKWWNFAYPSLINSGATAIDDFVAATSGHLDVGGTVGTLTPWGVTFARWNKASNPDGWSAANTILVPTRLPLGTVANAYADGSFTLLVPGAVTAATVRLSSAAGSATLAYQIDRTNGIVTVSPVDLTTSEGMAALSAGLVSGTPVKVYGVPQSDVSFKAYVIAYYTGDVPAN